MKKLITLLLICAAGATALNSCKKINNDLCSASHDSEKFTSVTITNGNTYYGYNTKMELGDVSYQTFYLPMSWGKSRFYIVTKVDHVCNKGDILLMPRTTLDIADPTITDTMSFIEKTADGNINYSHSYEIQIPLITSTVFQINETVPNKITDEDGSYEMHESISIPSQGSREADSIFFWDRVSHMIHRSQYYSSK